MPGIVSGIHQPVLRLLGRMEQPLGSHLRARRGRKHAENDKVRNETNNARNFHCPPPFSLAASKNAMRSFRSFSGSAFVSYAGINDSRCFSYDRHLALPKACNCRSEEHTSELQSRQYI